MAAFAALVLNNGTTNVSIAPSAIQEGVAFWRLAGGVFDAKVVITQSVTMPRGSSQVYRVKQKLVFPVMDTVDTSKKIGEMVQNVEYIIPKASLSADRVKFWNTAKSLSADAVTSAAVQDGEMVF